MKSRHTETADILENSRNSDHYVDAHPHTGEYKQFLRMSVEPWANPNTDRAQLSKKRRAGAWDPLIAFAVTFGGLYLAIAGVPDFVTKVFTALGL